MASKYEAKKDVCESSRPSAAQADIVAIRLEVDDLCPLPPSVQELAFSSSPAEMQETSASGPETPTTSKFSITTRHNFAEIIQNNFWTCTGVLDDADASKGALGQRVLHDITVETYTPQGEYMCILHVVCVYL